MHAVVIGGSPSAQRAAATLASQGREVTLVAPRLDDHALPEGRGAWISDGGPAGQPLALALYGGTSPLQASRALRTSRLTLPLPLSTASLARLLPPAAIPAAAQGWARARAANALADLIGGGQEQRSFQDWLSRRLGPAATDALFGDYARRRFGDPADLSCNVARLLTAPAHTLYAPNQPLPNLQQFHIQHLAASITRIEGAGPEKTITTSSRTLSGQVFVDAPPSEVLSWLGTPADTGIAVDARHLRARTRAQVCLRAPELPKDLPFESHVLDNTARFYRITRPGALPGYTHLSDRLSVHYALDDQAALLPDDALIQDATDALSRLHLPTLPTDAIVRRTPHAQPAWSSVHLSRLRRYALALDEAHVRPVGRAGTHSLRDPSEELAYLHHICQPEASARVCIRDWLEPPVDDPLRVHLRAWLAR